MDNNRFVLFALAAFASVTILLLAGAFMHSSRSNTLTSQDVQYQNELRGTFLVFSFDLEDYGDRVDCLECSFSEVVQAIASSNPAPDEVVGELYLDVLRDGRDPWGSEILFYRDPEGAWVVRSIGPNRIDEYGGGDDVEMRIELSETD